MPHPSSIDYFKSNFLKNGLAKPSRYEVQMISSAGSELTMMAETVVLPSRGFITMQEQWYGPVRDIPIGNKYDSSVIMTFPVSTDQTERFFFERWMDGFVNNKDHNWYSSEVAGSTLKILTLDEQGQTTSAYEFIEPYPSNIFPINLGANMFNDYTRLQVQFAYRKYVIKKK